MRTIALKNPSNDVKRLLAVAKNEDVVVEAPGGEKFILSPMDDFDYEIVRQRQNKKLMAFLGKRFKEARQGKGIPLQEAFLQLGLKPKKAKPGSLAKKMENADRRNKN